MIKVSAVITAYNYAPFLREAIDSAIGQTYPAMEVIVVDDGSTDDTPAILREYGARIRSGRIPNSGQAKAKNVGASLATGALIAFLDADDIWTKDKIEKQAALFADTAVGVVYSRRFWMRENGQVTGADTRPMHRGSILQEIFISNFICFSSAVIRREVWEKLGPMDERLSMGIDYDLWLRCAPHVRFDYSDDPLVYYRTGHANMSRNKDRRFESALLIMKKFLMSKDGKMLPPRLVKLAYADTYANWAYCYRGVSYWSTLRLYLKALSYRPIHWASMKGLAWLHSKYLFQPRPRAM